jgi:hypothetical protein
MSRSVLSTCPLKSRTHATFQHAPALVMNVALNNWQFLHAWRSMCALVRRRVGSVQHPSSDDCGTAPVPLKPSDPPSSPFMGLYGRNRWRNKARSAGSACRNELRGFERLIRRKMATMFGAVGFDARRGIAGIILSRWGRVVQPPGFYYGRDGKPSAEIVAKYGRIAIGHPSSAATRARQAPWRRPARRRSAGAPRSRGRVCFPQRSTVRGQVSALSRATPVGGDSYNPATSMQTDKRAPLQLIADFVAGSAPPAEARQRAAAAVIDTIGVAIAGSIEPAARVVRASLHFDRPSAPDAGCSVGHNSHAARRHDAAWPTAPPTRSLRRRVSCPGASSAPLVPTRLAVGRLPGPMARPFSTPYVIGFGSGASSHEPASLPARRHCRVDVGALSAAGSARLLGSMLQKLRTLGTRRRRPQVSKKTSAPW